MKQNPVLETSKISLDGLVNNYLRTPNGTSCSSCGIVGKHYLPDKQPLLYWYKKKWMCERCINVDRKRQKVADADI